MEDNLNGEQPQWKMTTMKDDHNWRRTQWKTTSLEDDLNGRQSQWKTTSRKPYRKQMTSACLFSQLCIELCPVSCIDCGYTANYSKISIILGEKTANKVEPFRSVPHDIIKMHSLNWNTFPLKFCTIGKICIPSYKQLTTWVYWKLIFLTRLSV